MEGTPTLLPPVEAGMSPEQARERRVASSETAFENPFLTDPFFATLATERTDFDIRSLLDMEHCSSVACGKPPDSALSPESPPKGGNRIQPAFDLKQTLKAYLSLGGRNSEKNAIRNHWRQCEESDFLPDSDSPQKRTAKPKERYSPELITGGYSSRKEERRRRERVAKRMNKCERLETTINSVVEKSETGISVADGISESDAESALRKRRRGMKRGPPRKGEGQVFVNYRVRCAECGIDVWAAHKVRHILHRHLGKDAFLCPYCEYGSFTKWNAEKHVQDYHKTLPVMVKNEVPNYKNEIDDWKKACFPVRNLGRGVVE